MFRYKANLVSKHIPEEHSKITRLSSSDSYSSKESVNPSKDSWVYSKEGYVGHRKSRRHHHSSSHDLRTEHDDESSSYRDRNRIPTPESDPDSSSTTYQSRKMKGLKILCSVIGGIILLLAAAVILGIWIILGTSEDGSFYFPWSASANVEAAQTEETFVTFEQGLKNATKFNDYMEGSKTDIILPENGVIEEITQYKNTNQEVEETLGHFQAMRPRPNNAGDSQTTHGSVEYYYDEYYVDDAEAKDTIAHVSSVVAPPGFSNRVHVNNEETEKDSNDFRVHIGNSDGSNDYDDVVFEIHDTSFKPSPPIIHDGPVQPGVLLMNEAGKIVLDETDPPKNFHEGVTKTEYSSDNTEEKLAQSGSLNDRSPIKEIYHIRPKEPEFESLSEQSESNLDLTHLSYTENKKLPDTRNDKLMLKEEYSSREDTIFPGEGSEPKISVPFYRDGNSAVKDLNSHTPTTGLNKNDDPNPDTITYFESMRDSPAVDIDPHRNFFLKNYDSSEIVLDGIYDRQLPRTPMPSPDMRSFIRSQQSENRRITLPPTLRRIPDALRYQNRRRQAMRNQMIRQRMLSRRRLDSEAGVPPNQLFYTNYQMRRSRIPNAQMRHIRPDAQYPHKQIITQRDDSYIAESITHPTVVRPDGTPVNFQNRRYRNGNPSRRIRPTQRVIPSASQQIQNPFFNALQSMYDYSKRLANSLIALPSNANEAVSNTTGKFLKESFSLLKDYDSVFQHLPRVFTEPLRTMKLPNANQIEKLDPFELSLMTWTFIDFWEFLIEKVGSLSRQDLQILETRLERIRQQKDTSIARAFMSSVPNTDIKDTQTFQLPSVSEAEMNLEDHTKNIPSENGQDTQLNASTSGQTLKDFWDPLGLFTDEERFAFMQYAIKTLFNFGKVYLKSDYAMDCMMLLFCKDINSKSKTAGMEALSSKLKSVGLQVLVDKEGREADTVSSVWRALTQWEPLQCEAMFPKCDGSRALEIVNEVANAARR